MDFAEKRALVHRIMLGKLHKKVILDEEEYLVCFSDPKLEIKTYADFIYQQELDSLKDKDVPTIDQTYDLLKIQGVWTNKLSNELDILPKEIKTLEDQLIKSKFHKAKQRTLIKAISKGKARIKELTDIKNQLYSSSAEYLAESAQRDYIISNITEGVPKEKLKSKANISTLSVYYYRECGIPDEKMRELARSEPWRLYWTTSKNSGSQLFQHSLADITDLQYSLILWSRVYDFAFESMNRPDEATINDDIRFDAWYKQEVDRISKESNNKQQDATKYMGDETYIMCDAEGSKEVYALNNPEARRIIRSREKAILEKGTLLEADLPDIKQELSMKAAVMLNKG